MSAHPSIDSILPSRFTQLPDPGADLIADAEDELAADAARVLAEAEAEVELGEELLLDGLKLDTGEAVENLDADEGAGQAAAGPVAVEGATADGSAGGEVQEPEARVELAETGAELGGEALLSRQAGSGEATEEELEEWESDGEAESESADGSESGAGATSGEAGRGKRRGSARLHNARKIQAATAGARSEAGKPLPGEAASNARFFFCAVNLGKMSEEEARQSIAVPEGMEAEWRAFAKRHPRAGSILIESLRLRRRAMTQFDRLLASATSSPSPAADHGCQLHTPRGEGGNDATPAPAV